MKEGCIFPVSASWVMCSPRTEEQQPCSVFSVYQRAVSWSLCVVGRALKCSVLDCCFSSSEDMGCEPSLFAPG